MSKQMTKIEYAERRARIGKNAGCRDIAKALGIDYDGDMNLEHGGMFYDISTWKEFGYADACRVDIADGSLFIDCGTVNRNNVVDALKCCGYRYDDCGNIENDYDAELIASADDVDTIARVEIFACASYAGVDSDGSTVCKITDRDERGNYSGEYFADGNCKRISFDDMEGYIVSNYVVGSVIELV